MEGEGSQALPGPCSPECRAGRVVLAGSLTRVDVGVLLHVRLLVEALAAELAGVGPRVRVDEQVGGQSGRTLEGFAAHLALEAALLPGETRPWGVRRRRRTGPGRDPLRNRTLCWGGLEGQASGPPPSCLPGGTEAWAKWPPVGFFLVTFTVSQTKDMFVDGLMDALIWECFLGVGEGGVHISCPLTQSEFLQAGWPWVCRSVESDVEAYFWLLHLTSPS